MFSLPSLLISHRKRHGYNEKHNRNGISGYNYRPLPNHCAKRLCCTMPLLSLEFAVFFLLFFPLYWCLHAHPQKQNLLLLAAGLFWLWQLSPAFALTLIVFSSAIHFIARRLQVASQLKQRRRWLTIGLVAACGNLVFFKYVDFFRHLWQNWTGSGIIDLVLPIGISYYTFQAMAYLLSLYRRENVMLPFANLFLHFGFFPTLTAGPIARAGRWTDAAGQHEGMATQLNTQQPRRIVQPALAVSLIVLGVAKKWWLAGNLADAWVDPVFANPLQYSAWTVWASVYGYTAQLFLDFSGYTDLVLGMAMLLGFKLPENFLMPLRATDIRAFWSRWHISLSSWIRDHIYIPLGGSRHGFWRTQINLMLAMVLSGIWHGQGWNFFVWGALHGLALVWLNLGQRYRKNGRWLPTNLWGKIASWFCTVQFVCLAFVIFRTRDLSEAALVFQGLIPQGFRPPEAAALSLMLLLALAVWLHPLFKRLFDFAVARLDKLPLRYWPLPLGVALCLLIVLAPSGIPNFIYANF